MTVSNFEDLEVWKLARELTNEVYRVSGLGNFSKDYLLSSLLKKS